MLIVDWYPSCHMYSFVDLPYKLKHKKTKINTIATKLGKELVLYPDYTTTQLVITILVKISLSSAFMKPT